MMGRRRLRVLAVLVVTYVAALTVVWTRSVSMREYLVLATIGISFVAVLADSCREAQGPLRRG